MGKSDGKVTLSTALNNAALEKGLKGLAKTVGATATAITAAFGTAAVAITKQSVAAYADYEQLTGGIETMFKNSAKKVAAYAEDAFYTAGVSGNEYMETVTGFSASLISSLGGDTAKAADIANMAMIDMADNANKMGTSIENVKTAYQGFAKQQYMLLDNLKLGYGGTKTEMERLLKDAQAYSGVEYDINNLGDVYSAIHAIQEKLGIAGATAEEAEKTITGSANMTKAAWKNVLAAISGGGDLDKAINNLVYSISKYFDNIVPVVERSLAGIGQMIERIAPQLVQTVASALIKALPSLLNAVYQMIVGLAKGIYQGIIALISGQSATTEISAQLGGIADSANSAAEAEEALADGITAASKAAKKSLAGFDELNQLQDNSSSSSSSTGSTSATLVSVDTTVTGAIENLEEQSKSATEKVSGFGKAIESLFYETLGKIDLTRLYNLSNAVTMIKNSATNFLKTLSVSFDKDSITDYFAWYQGTNIETLGTFLTAYSGWLNVQTAINNGDSQGYWEGLGRIGGAIGQLTVLWNEVIGAESIFGVETEKLREIYFPIIEEIPNLFRGVTTDQAKALKKLNSSIKSFEQDVSEIAWADTIITDDEMKLLLSSFDGVLNEVEEHVVESKETAIENINDLVSKGIMTDSEAKYALEELEKTYSKEEALLSNSKSRISEILEKAKNESRALTEVEKSEILGLTKAAQEEIIAVVKVGSADRTRIMEELNATHEGLSKVRLSQIIQFANAEYDAQVSAANATYEDTVAEADKLYYELGIISEAQYNDIVSAAQRQKDEQIKAARDAKTELVDKAHQTAGEVADAVDPDTGEILSNWELTWNRMYEKVKDFKEDIKGVLNGIIDHFNGLLSSAGKTINGAISALNKLSFNVPDWDIFGDAAGKKFGFNLKSVTVPQIPYLAQGAVLPPNKPFMAVVGDQRHGTNVEAPLSTIQEAVALVMQDQTSAILAGFEASVGVQREILEAVLGIQIGDDVIGNAVARYSNKQAVIRGGAL